MTLSERSWTVFVPKLLDRPFFATKTAAAMRVVTHQSHFLKTCFDQIYHAAKMHELHPAAAALGP
jgi:hypothetical protein